MRSYPPLSLLHQAQQFIFSFFVVQRCRRLNSDLIAAAVVFKQGYVIFLG
jgi:hypothetical protein